jgi:hypothetical protein
MLPCFEEDWSLADDDFWKRSKSLVADDTHNSFETHIDETIARHPKEAALGGRPGIRNKIRAFVDVTMRSKDAQESFKPEVSVSCACQLSCAY